MSTTKLTGNIGAEVSGVDLSTSLTDQEASELRDALATHHVIVVRGQQLTIPLQKEMTEVFGEVMTLPYIKPLPDDDEVIAVLKKAEEVNTGVFGGDWHSDFSFLENPPAGSVLNAVELPPVGGDTLWVNQATAYETLPDHLRDIVDTHGSVHVGAPYGVKHAPPKERQANASVVMDRNNPDADREIVHPSVITSPDNGERSLFLNPIYTTRFDGMTEQESAPLLAEIYRHAVRPDFGYRHRWQAGDVLVWNNRTTLHFATNDYDGYRRLLYRTTYQRQAPQ